MIKTLGNKYVKSVDDFITGELDYNYTLLQDNKEGLDERTVQLGMQILSGMADTTRDNEQAELSKRLQEQLKGYENKFAALQGK